MERLLTWALVMEATREALIEIATPEPGGTSSSQVLYPGGSLHLKAAAFSPFEALSVKANLRPTTGSSSGAILAFDLARHELSAVLDSSRLTSVRTAAIATVAAQTLLPSEPCSLAMLGLGPVGRESTSGMLKTLQVSSLHLWSRHRSSAEDFERQLSLDVPVVVHDSPGSAASEADLIVTSTPSQKPILLRKDLRENSTVLALGADTAGKRELDESLIEVADVVADVREDALRFGESAYLPPHLSGDVSELSAFMTGSATLKRKRHFLVFDSVGSALVDAAVVGAVVKMARETGEGDFIHLAG